MSETDKRAERDEAANLRANAAEDQRKPYEAPKLVKKRSVAQATLFTAMGPSSVALTMMG